MARIAGIVVPNASRLIETMAVGLAHGTQVAPDAALRVAPRGDVALTALAHHGHKALFDGGGLAVLLDGFIFNRWEFGAFASDPELLADLYRRHGFEGALSRINGDFAAAVYDKVDNTLWLARDRLGVKPLYYADNAPGFAFASRPRALIGLPGVGTAPNLRFTAIFAGSHYRYIDNRPEESPYANVHQLPAGQLLRLRNGTVTVSRYWAFEERPEWTGSEDELAEQYRALLLDAVGLRVSRATDKRVFTLSGGMDSSSVLACAAQALGAPQQAISTVYSDKTYDESEDIRPMLDHSVSRWNQVLIDNPDVFGTIRRMVEANDEPVATATWLSHFLLCERAAREGFDTLFGGLGGDELNAGEYEYFFFHFADLMRRGENHQLDHEVAQWAAHHDHPIYRKDSDVAKSTVARCSDPAQPGRCLPDLGRMTRYYSAIEPDFYDPLTFTPVADAPFTSYLKTRTYQDLTRETAPCCLRAEDRQTAAFGLENHLPFFDFRLVEFMFRVPGSMKIRDGVTKILLRKAMKGLLPEETRTRVKKTGWNAPAHLWFAGRGREELHDMIHSRAFCERGVYNVKEVQRLVAEHDAIVQSGAMRENHMMFIWQMVNTEIWLASLDRAVRLSGA